MSAGPPGTADDRAGDQVGAWPENAAGRFFVDRECIDCDLCRTTAPDNFARSEQGYSFVARQPQTPQQERDCLTALRDCPVEAIHGDAEG
ncbi:MAG: ferredoxin [Planctomycetota bacterium]